MFVLGSTCCSGQQQLQRSKWLPLIAQLYELYVRVYGQAFVGL